MASNINGGSFQRGGRPAPAPADGGFFGLAALVFGAGFTIMIVAAIVAMFISSKSETAVAVEPEMTAPIIMEEPVAAPSDADDSEVVGDDMDAAITEEAATGAPEPAMP